MIQRARILALLALGTSLLSQLQTASGAVVNFGPAIELTDSSDFDPLSNIIYAINGGSSGDDQTVDIGGAPVLFESIMDTSNATTVGSATFSGAIGDLYTTPTDQTSLDEILNSHHFVDGDGAAFSITLQNLSVGQSYRLQIIAPADTRDCCNARSHDVASVDGGTAGTLFRLADLDGDTVAHTTSIIGDFTADATGNQPADGNGDNLVNVPDYVVWRDNPGASVLPASAASHNPVASTAIHPGSVAVPEPAT